MSALVRWLRSRSLPVVLVLAVLLPLSCAATVVEGAERPQRSVADWAAAFDARADPLAARAQQESRSGDSWDQYQLAYAVDAFTSMYEATGRRAYLEVALARVEDVVARARPSAQLPTSQYRDEYLGWVSQRPDVRGREIALFESYLWRYVARLLRVIDTDPALRDDARLQQRQAALLDFTERQIVDKWFSRGRDAYVLRSRTHMASHWAYIGVELAEITDDPERRARYEAVADAVDDDMPNFPSSLRDQLDRDSGDDGPYVWSDVWGSSDPAQDVAHGNGVITYVVAAHERGRDWDDEDLARFSLTLTENVLRADGSAADLVDGSGTGTGWLSDGFVRLGGHDPAVQARLERHEPANEQFVAAMALNARRLALEAS